MATRCSTRGRKKRPAAHEPTTAARQPKCSRGLIGIVLVGVAGLAVFLTQGWFTSPGASVYSTKLRALGQTGRAAGYNVLLVTLDTVRADHLGCYGHDAAHTPTIDALCEPGVRFAQAIAPAPITLPSHATMLTGLDVPAHGVRDNGTFHLAEERTTLAEVFREHGYATAAFVAAFVLDRRYGLAQGFDHYDDGFKPEGGAEVLPGGASSNYRSAESVTTSAVTWLEQAVAAPPARPFFAWVHYFDAHAPYEPPRTFAELTPGSPYDGEIAYVDAQLGRLLEFLRQKGVYGRTLIVVAADHGEGLGEHSEPTHAYLIYDTTVRVPLILHCPMLLDHAYVVGDRVVGLVDIAPTVLDLVGLRSAAAMDGQHLFTAPADKNRAIYIETLATRLNNGWASLHGLRRLHDKYIEAPTPEYFDLAADPREVRNAHAESPVSGELAEQLAARMAQWPAVELAVGEASAMNLEEAERLASLGYVRSAPPAGEVGVLDPKDMMPLWNSVLVAERQSLAGRHDVALAKIEQVLEEDPTNGHAWYYASYVNKRLNRFGRAEECVRRALELSPSAAGYVNLAQLLLMRGSGGAEFGRVINQATQFDPKHGGIYIARGDWLVLHGRFGDALAAFRSALSADPVNYGVVARRKIDWIHAHSDL